MGLASLYLYIVQLSGTIAYDILNLSAQKYFCKNVNHLNFFCVLFVEEIVVKSQNCWTELGWVLIGMVISFPLFINQLILDVNLATYWLKYSSSGTVSFVFSSQYKLGIPMIYNMTIFDKVNFSPLRNVSWRRPCTLNDT